MQSLHRTVTLKDMMGGTAGATASNGNSNSNSKTTPTAANVPSAPPHTSPRLHSGARRRTMLEVQTPSSPLGMGENPGGGS